MHDAATIATFKNACCTDSSRQLSAEMLTDNVAMQIIFRCNGFRVRADEDLISCGPFWL